MSVLACFFLMSSSITQGGNTQKTITAADLGAIRPKQELFCERAALLVPDIWRESHERHLLDCSSSLHQLEQKQDSDRLFSLLLWVKVRARLSCSLHSGMLYALWFLKLTTNYILGGQKKKKSTATMNQLTGQSIILMVVHLV